MNILLWILQGVLALLYVSGGGYKLSKTEDLMKHVRALSPAGWRALGALEIVGGILLIVPAAVRWMPALTPVAAAVLALETLGLAAMYARRSLELVAANPLVWAAVMGVLAAVVAYGRYALVPVV